MTVRELYAALSADCPAALSAEWDHDGLAVCGNADAPVRRVLIALDVTERTAARAVCEECDVILTHHPLLFHKLGALTEEDAVSRRVMTLFSAGISAMSFHTRLDAAAGGVNDVLAEKLGVKDTVPFGPGGETPCGRVGTLEKETDAAAFAARVKEVLGAPAVVLSGEGKISRVAILGGEGGDYLDAAKAAGADLFLSGSIGYHRMLDAPEKGLLTLEAGHFYTERPVLEELQKRVAAADAAIVTVTDENEPFRVLV